MPKGYWIVSINITNQDAFKAYVAANVDALKKYGARYLARAARYESVEGAARTRNSILEFPTYQAALDCWHSPEYQAAKKLRDSAAELSIIIVEGYEGPQP